MEPGIKINCKKSEDEPNATKPYTNYLEPRFTELDPCLLGMWLSSRSPGYCLTDSKQCFYNFNSTPGTQLSTGADEPAFTDANSYVRGFQHPQPDLKHRILFQQLLFLLLLFETTDSSCALTRLKRFHSYMSSTRAYLLILLLLWPWFYTIPRFYTMPRSLSRNRTTLLGKVNKYRCN